MADSSYYLYTSLGCHLCEMAEQLLQIVMADNFDKVMLVEISDSDDLMASYGLRIPVLAANSNSGQWHELGWPFGIDELNEFFDQLKL